MNIRGTDIVVKRNVLNELRTNNMTLQELRFFSASIFSYSGMARQTVAGVSRLCSMRAPVPFLPSSP